MAFRDFRDLLRQMETDMERFTDEAFYGFYNQPGTHRFWQPNADMHETDSGVVIKMELAGATADNITVALSADGRKLTVGGARSEKRDEREHRCACHQLEIYFGPFERTFGLPAERPIDRDAISANLRDGFLTIVLPYRARQQEPVTRTIRIQTGTDDTDTNDNR